MRDWPCTRSWLLVLAASTAACAVQAQLIDDVDIRRAGADAVVAVRFVTPVQFVRLLTVRNGDLAQVYYNLLPTREALDLNVSERRVPGGNHPGAFLLGDEPAGTGERNRKLVLRFASSVGIAVRAGRGDRTIELVLKGKADELLAAAPAVAAASRPPPLPLPQEAVPAPAAWSLVLRRAMRSEELGQVPGMLQDYAVEVRPSTAPGRDGFELVLQGLRSEDEALRLKAQLSQTYPDSEVRADLSGRRPEEGPLPGAELLVRARRALAAGEYSAAVRDLEAVLDLPPGPQTETAQGLIGQARWRQGDPERARAEFELYLKQYPQGAAAATAREALLTLAPPAPVVEQAQGSRQTSELSGSVSLTYFGGQSKVRTQDFQDSPLSGLPELLSDATLSGTDQKLWLTSVDLNWRRRDESGDMRVVFRDTYSADQLRPDKSKNKLSAFYAEYRQSGLGYNVRVGRQSPSGGGVMGRFDGITAGYRFLPKWRLGAVLGQPSDSLLSARRHFYGGFVDMDEITPALGASVYAIEQRIDSEIDRRGLGTEVRYFKGNFNASGLFDYDTMLRAVNIAMVQATWQPSDVTTVNVLLDRRTTPMLALGNSLFFQNPILGLQASRIQELLASQSLAQLRRQVVDTTPYSTQAMAGFTRSINGNWQWGADLRLTNVGALQPVPDILPNGQPGTGNIYSTGLQLIGTNLYSARDTHVGVFNALRGPTYTGYLLSYNNASVVGEGVQLEPALRYYQQSDNTGLKTRRWSPGLRATYRPMPRVALESEVSLEFSRSSGPNRNESSRRTFFYLGVRYEL